MSQQIITLSENAVNRIKEIMSSAESSKPIACISASLSCCKNIGSHIPSFAREFKTQSIKKLNKRVVFKFFIIKGNKF